MKKSKILILLFTLSFPVILYLFLRSYGQNEFDLPIFFENEEKAYCKDLESSNKAIELVDLNQKNFVRLSEVYNTDYKIIHFPSAQDSEIQTLKNELNRVLNTFGDVSVNILSFQPIDTGMVDQLGNELFLSAAKANTYLYPNDLKDFFVNCIYMFPTKEWNGDHPSEETIDIDKTLVLLDEQNRIRGYYNGYETKEVDRLILEIRVLLSKK
jgi:protein SCO1/2